MENDIAKFQRLGAFHAASAMECVVKGGSAHLKMAVWHQNHAAHFYASACGMLTKPVVYQGVGGAHQRYGWWMRLDRGGYRLDLGPYPFRWMAVVAGVIQDRTYKGGR